MAENLVKENVQIGVASNPVIVKNVASLEGGNRIYVRNVASTYKGGTFTYDDETYPKVLLAGHLVYQDPFTEVWYSVGSDGTLEDASTGGLVGVILNDTNVSRNIVAFNGGDYAEACASIMVMGVVDVKAMPVSLEYEDENECIFDVDKECYECHIAFVNKHTM